jgi:type I restriction enzyme M protein
LIVARYFAEKQQAIEQLQADLDSVSAQLGELEDEHSGEDAVFAGFDKINKAEVSSRIREIGHSFDTMDEISVLERWLKLSTDEAALKKGLKDAEAELDAKAYAHYPTLSEADIKTLVVDDKWLANLDTAIHGEMDRISQQLTQRVKQLAERYETPVPQINLRVDALEAKVNGHLQRMGFAWS